MYENYPITQPKFSAAIITPDEEKTNVDQSLFNLLKSIEKHIDKTLFILTSTTSFEKVCNYLKIMFFSNFSMSFKVESMSDEINRRSPLLLIKPPSIYFANQSRSIKNFKENSENPISPYDIYKTLKDIAEPFQHSSDNSAVSIFHKIPPRTCKEMKTPKEFCNCLRVGKNSDHRLAEKFQEKIVDEINEKLKNHFDICYKQSPAKVLQSNHLILDEVKLIKTK